MLYRSERNTGCRFHEVMWEGMRTLVLENRYLHITVVLDHGADILEFNHKPTDTDFVWRNPMGLSGLKKLQMAPVDSDMFADNYLGGFFEIIPSVGGGGNYKGIRFGGYCESNQLPWEYEVVEDREECVSLRCFVRLNKLPILAERVMTLKKDSAALVMEEKITNIGLEPIDYQWGWHPNIGGGFLNGDCVIDAPGGEMTVLRASDRFGKEASGIWPVLRDTDGRCVDYSHILPPDSMHDELVDVAFDAGWSAVRDTKQGVGIGLSWDHEMFPVGAIWQSSCHKEGHFRLGGAYVMCYLLRNCKTMGLPQAAEKGETTPLPGKSSRSSYLTLSVFEDNRPVIGVDKDGTVRF